MRILVSGQSRVVQRLAGSHCRWLGRLLTPSCRAGPAVLARTGLPWALDNGAFSGFDPEKFTRKLEQCVGVPGLLFVVSPDVVADARATLALWEWWALLIRSPGLPAAFVLQDGQEDHDLPDADAYFVGGSTRWKLSRASVDLMAECRRRGKHLHVGRVNSLRRLRWAWECGADSVDGSGYSRFAAVAAAKGSTDMLLERHLRYLAALEHEQARQPLLFGE